ncbi:MAG: hypothetical protein JW730_16475 [Anaerolineales bacterium]|nr:hypothetical protein [Anaerolineales bacterium]
MLIPGVGTGADLPLLPAGVEATGISRLGDLTRGCPCAITHDEPGIAGGLYRVLLLKKTG